MNLTTGLEKIYKCDNVHSVLEIYQEIILGISTRKISVPDSLYYLLTNYNIHVKISM